MLLALALRSAMMSFFAIEWGGMRVRGSHEERLTEVISTSMRLKLHGILLASEQFVKYLA